MRLRIGDDPKDQTRNLAQQRLDSGFALTRAARLCRGTSGDC
jgi:hypothetical protein